MAIPTARCDSHDVVKIWVNIDGETLWHKRILSR